MWWGNLENLLKGHQGAGDAEKQSKGFKGWEAVWPALESET